MSKDGVGCFFLCLMALSSCGLLLGLVLKHLETILEVTGEILSAVLPICAVCGLYWVLVIVFEELDRIRNDRA